MITEDISTAASIIKEGKIVAFPTETVWGLGANALNPIACQKIYTIKKRPADNPLILHLSSIDDIKKLVIIDESILHKLERWIPGPLTLIAKKRETGLFSCGLETVALRVPAHELTRSLIEKSGCPIAAPSANLSGKPSLTRFSDVVEHFEGVVDCILKGADPMHGIESTVIDLSKPEPVYVRPGVISFEELKAYLPNLQRWGGGELISPGMKYKHYSPNGTVLILSDLKEIEPGSGQIGFDLIREADLNTCVKDNVEYAKELYAFFVKCDKLGLQKVYCQIPKEGVLYQAILHRLEKAAYR